jgi:phage major head subunit gpT-like protein
MPMISDNWADLLNPIVRKWTDVGFARRPSLLQKFYNVQSSTRAYEEISAIGAIGVDAWNDYNKSGVIPEVDFNQGYKKTYTHIEYPLDFSIERKLIDDNNYPEVFRVAQRIGDSSSLKREIDRASTWNNGFNDTFAGADGVGLLSTAHPFSPSNTGSTQSNEFTLPLTAANLETVRVAMMGFTDDNGNIVAVNPNVLHVPRQLENTARIITASLNDPDTANNAINPQQGRWTVEVDHYLTDANAWFVEDSTLRQMHLDWFDRVPFGVKMRDGDDRTVRSYWRAYQRYSFGWSSWIWIAGSNPS